MTYVETRTNVWEALAGRAPGEPVGPADPGLWGAVVDRLNPARARPVLRAGIEAVQLISARGAHYVMLRSPDDGSRAGYLRLTPQEWQLALMMDGTATVARLVAEFARIAGRLAPDQVRRIVADLAGNLMLDDLPVDAFRPLAEFHRKPVAERVGNSVLAAARGRRMLVFDVDNLVTKLHRAGGRLFFARVTAIVLSLLAVAGLGLFATTWTRGSQSLFLTDDSYLLGAISLLLLNGVVLGARELSRALAAKHAGREVPAAGLLVYFGIPSIFVDTADVWMAGRRARLLVAASGPLGALMLAGVIQMVGLAVPFLGGLAFKLAFLWYLNVFFNLSPLLPLDGYYLLMDWLEIPQLRARGLSWVTGRRRGRSTRWSALDREGRLIGLYGMLAVLWLAVAAALVFRVWTDRIAGLVTGLTQQGPLGTVLLVLVVLGLASPVVYFVLGRAGAWWRRARQRAVESDREADSPRRLAALRASDLGGLPEPALHGLAARARWVRPPTGRQLVRAGGAQPAVYVVVEGALQGRRPGDPGGTIRHHVGPGGVVGLVNALTGRSTQLDWHTAGTALLAVPTATVATVVGPLPGPPPQDRVEAEALFADTPAIAGLAADQQLALIASAHPVDLEPGAPVILPGPTHAIVVESGVIAMPDGVELRRGTLVGPVGDGSPGMVAQTRTPVRLWVIPDASDLPPLVGATHRPGSSMPVVTVKAGPRPGHATADMYPPLAVPPGPPDSDIDPDVDRLFERRLWWLAATLLVLALVLTAVNFRPGPAWAEMPADRALLTVDRGQITTLTGGVTRTFGPGGRRYLDRGVQVDVPSQAGARLTFPGGAATLLCGGSRVEVGKLYTGGGRHQAPVAAVSLQSGRLLVDTTSTSGAYEALSLTVSRPQSDVVSSGPAWYAVDPAAVIVSTGEVAVGGATSVPAGETLNCGDGVPVTPPAAGEDRATTEAPFPTEEATLPTVAPSVTATPSNAPARSRTPTPTPDPTATSGTPAATTDPTRLPTTRPTTRPTLPAPTPKPTTRPTTKPPTPAPTTTVPTTTVPTPTQTSAPTSSTEASLPASG
ncbi:cyclic nucleotide-binding protein [Micromonosporaceae bacterium Da 78-11]